MDVIQWLAIAFIGCDKTRYSPGCVDRCPATCKSNHCDVFNGSCFQGCPNPKALTDDCIGKVSSDRWQGFYQYLILVSCFH